MTYPNRTLTLLALTSALALMGCFTETDHCVDQPNLPQCALRCADNPTHPTCIGDASVDGDTSVGDGDATPDADAALPCNGECEERLCIDSTCAQCIGGDDCDGLPRTNECDTDTHTCVECLDDARCADPAASQCSMRACAPCAGNDDCAGIVDIMGTALSVCDTSSATATCVECTASDDTACGTNVCDLFTNTCTDRAKSSAGLCQPCVNDTECSAGQLCVPTRFMDMDIGHFCLWREDAGGGGPAGACSRVEPYRRSEAATSINGVTTNVCNLRVTTCPALTQFDIRDCTDGTPPGTTDDECGHPGVSDGLCRAVDAAANRCTVPCDNFRDCPGTTPSCTMGHCSF